MRVHLRRDNAGPLTADQADESLDFLSGVTVLTVDTQLHGGGTYYQPASNLRHGLPTSGTLFSLTVESGTATLVGTVDGTTNPVYTPGGEHRFVKYAGQWLEVAAPVLETGTGGGLAPYTVRALGGALDTLPVRHWMMNASPVTLVLPASADEGSEVALRRGNALVIVTVAASGTIVGYDAALGTLVERPEARLNTPHKEATFIRISGKWRVGT